MSIETTINYKLYRYHTGVLAVNTYILVNKTTGEGIAIDIGGNANYLFLESIKNQFNIKVILLTHGHFDHIGGVAFFKESGAKVYMGEKDYLMTQDDEENMGEEFGVLVKHFEVDGFLKEGEYEFCGFEVKVIETPGHTEGGLSYIIGNMIFSGDTLFKDSYGRVDFKGGDFTSLKNSINKLFSLEGDYEVYPGHEENTTLERERKYNPINY